MLNKDHTVSVGPELKPGYMAPEFISLNTY